jgi:Co/Zn/Cd efflux system component
VHTLPDKNERSALIKVLIVNATLFVTEFVAGLLSHSMGLFADSLDMLADALIYGLALYAIGRSVARKGSIARACGWIELTLACTGFVEVARRAMGYGERPDYTVMIAISLLALCGNIFSAVTLRRLRSEESHIKASVIVTSNDIYANFGVILAGALIFAFGSRIPDLVVGTLIFVLVMRGALKVIRLR